MLCCVRFALLLLVVRLIAASTGAFAQPGNAEMSASFTSGPLAVTLGQYFTCTLTINNGGWEIATNTVVTNLLPAGLQLISVKCSRGVCAQSNGVVSWSLGDLPPSYGVPATLTVEFKAVSTGSFTNSATVASDTPDPDLVNNQMSLVTRVTLARFFGVGRMHAGFINPTMTRLTNNQFFIAGLWPDKASDLYDPTTRAFTAPAGTLFAPRSGHSATLLNSGKVLLAGGASANGEKTSEVYDPVTQLFHRVGDMLVYSYGHSGTLQSNGTVLLCGGAVSPNELFNPVTETFSVAPSGPVCPPTGERLPDGRYFQGTALPSIYYPATGTSTSTVPMNLFRFDWTATAIPPDKVLVAGGDRNSDTAELYDIPSGTYTIMPKMTIQRHYHGATLLPDGTVLIIGGMNNVAYTDRTRAEVFDLNGTVNVPGVGVSDATLVEGDSGTNWMQFNVWLTSTSALPVSVDFASATGTAGAVDYGVANVDFAQTNGTLTIPAGQTNGTVLVPVFGDFVREPDETFTLNLSGPIQAWLARATATGTIQNNDPFPSFSIAPAVVSEFDTGLTNLAFSVTLSAPSLATVSVDFFSSDVTATAGSDYTTTSGTLTFYPGESAKFINVPVRGDLTVEPNETLKVTLTNAQSALIATNQATGTILNDDGLAGRLHHFDVSAIGAAQIQSIPFPVGITARDFLGNTVTNFAGPLRLTPFDTNLAAANLDFEQPVLAPWTVTNTGATPAEWNQISFDVDGDGRSSTAFQMVTTGGPDGIWQNVFLQGGVTYSISLNAAIVAVGNPDQWITGGSVYLYIGETNVGWGIGGSVGNGTARGSIAFSYRPPTNGVYPLRLAFTRTYLEGSLTMYADDLQINYPAFTPTVVTNAFTNGVWAGQLTVLQAATNVTLQADDDAGHKGWSNPFTVQPLADLGLGVTNFVVGTPPLRTGMKLQFNLALINRGPAAISDAAVAWTLPPNLSFVSATNKQGIVTNIAGQLTWTPGLLPAGSNTTASIVCRADIPGDFTNQFNILTSVLDLNPADNSVSLTNHIDPPLLVISDAVGTEGVASVTGMVFNVTLSGPSAQTITVDYFTSNGTATNNLDFVATNGVVTIPPGTTNATLRVYPIEDILAEPTRYFAVILTNAVNAIISDDTGVGTLNDDDPVPVVSIADTSLVEGDSGTSNAVFQLTLSKPAIATVSVRCVTSTGTAGTNDFVSTTTTVTFAAGLTNATFTVPVRGNTVNEPDETFTVTLSLPNGVTLGRSAATGTILNDDAVPGRLDHFVWDAIPSPRYKDWPFPVTLRGVDYLGGAATNSIGTTLVTARTESGVFNRLFDDFEDGDSVGWTNINAAFSAIVTNETAAAGTKSLRLTGSTANTLAGLRRPLTNTTPNKITFAVRASRTNQIAGRFTAYANSIYRSAVFYFNEKGQMGLQDRIAGFRGVPYQSNRWYQVSLTMNWAAQKIDCAIDGALVLTNVNFAESTATYMDAVLLANQDNTTAWWDDIRVFNDNLTNVFAVNPSNFVAFTSGVKTNLVTVNGAATNTYFTADDGLEHVGNSGFFELRQAGIILTTPASATEGVGTVSAQVSLPVPFPQAVTVTLTSAVPSELTVPASVVIPANQTNASFNLTIIDDALLDGAQLVSVSALATNFIGVTNVVSVEDNEPAVLTLTVPASAAENAGTLVAQGQIVSSAPPAKPATVTLTSSDTNVVQVPASVVIQSNQTAAVFNLVIVNNQRLDGDHPATITASVVNWTGDSKVITVIEDETATLQFTGPALLNEGAAPTNYTVTLGGTVTTNVTVALNSSDTNALTLPGSVDVLAGQLSVSVPVTAPDNARREGTKSVTLSAQASGFGTASTNVNVTDNDVDHFNFSAITSPQQGNVAFNLTVSARDTNNVLMTWYSTNVALSAQDGLGNPVPISPTSVSLANGQWSGGVTVTAWEFAGVHVTATDPGGVASTSTAFDIIAPVVSLLGVVASDLAYSESTKLLYASVTNGGLLRVVDPVNAVLGPAIAINSLSGRLCAADGGQFIFAALNGATNHICQFDVNSQSVVNAWALDGVYVEDMAPVPGSSNAVAVSRRIINGGSPRYRGVVIYDNSVARSNSNNGFLGSNVIETGRKPGRLYGYNNETSPAGFQIMNVDSNGITVVGGWGALQGFGVDIACRGGWLFATTGAIYDPERGIQVGSYGGLVGDDAPSGRYYLVSAGAIVAYDQNTLLPVGSTALTGVTGAAGSLVRWGTNGFAFRMNSSTIAIIRTPLIATGAGADLRLSAQLPPIPVVASNRLTFTLTVTNQGSATAKNVVLTQTLPGNSTFLSATNTAGTNSTSSGGLVAALSAIPAGGSASVTVNLQTLQPGLLSFVASVTSDSLDANLADNVTNLDVSVVRPSMPDSVTEVLVPTTDLVWDKFSGRLFASAPNADWLRGNSLIALDPATGRFEPRLALAMEPARVAVSDNGQYLYAGINSDTSIQRVTIASRTADLKFPTTLNNVADIAVLPGSPESVAVTAHTTFAVYDNGVRRPNTVAPGAYNFEYYLAVSGTNTLAYEAPPGELRRIALDGSGATLLDSSGLINGFDRDITFDAGLLYTSGGRVIDPEAHVVVTNLAFSGLVCPDSTVSKIFYLTVAGSTGVLHAVQSGSFSEMGAVTITNISGTPSSLVRWGTDGLAFRTSSGQIFLVRTTLADDRDNDGLPDSWEQQYFAFYNSPGSSANDDPDGDGMTNLQEWRAGLNPVIYDAVRFLSEQPLTNGGFQLTALVRPQQSYVLFASTNLHDWMPLTNFSGTNLTVMLLDSAAANYALRFYRLGPQSDIPPPSLAFGAPPLASNGVNLVLSGFTGIGYRLQSSTNLVDWFTVTSFTSTNGLMPLRDPSATNDACRFYRVTIP